MVYGVQATVAILLGGTDTYFTTGNIDAAIVIADVFVDRINSSATDARKTQASNLISTNILLKGRVNKKLKGLDSDSGNAGRPSRASAYDMSYVPDEAMELLMPAIPDPIFYTYSPE